MSSSIAEILQEKQYVVVPNFLDAGIRAYLQFYTLKMWSSGRWSLRDVQTPQSIAISRDPLYEVLLDYKTRQMSELVGKRLAPTYSYGRVYVDGSVLPCHHDRSVCEYSVSVTVGASEGLRWDLYLVDKQGERNYVHLEPGDAVIYKGPDVDHGRDKLECGADEYMVQIFLHYVDKDGPYADQIYEGRERLGY